MSYPGYDEDAFTLGKNALANVADLGASRAGKLVVEITSNLLNLNQEGFDNEYLKWHLKALFTEFVTGEDYDLPYYDKPSAVDALNAKMQDVIVKNEHDPNCACSRCHSEKLPLIQKEPRTKRTRWWQEDPMLTKNNKIYMVGMALMLTGLYGMGGTIAAGISYLVGIYVE